MDVSELSSWFLDNIQKIFFPEEWIALDQKLSKIELLSLFFVERQGDITMTKLADYLATPLSTVTGIVDRLVKGGFLARERPEADRRIVTIRLTDQGRSITDQLRATIQTYLSKVTEVLTAEEQAEALRIVMKVIGALQAQSVARGAQAGPGDRAQNSPIRIEID
jgi:DNA-binding MarR family transcriptional regulator